MRRILPFLALLLVPQWVAASGDGVADRVLEGLQNDRAARGAPALKRRSDLDAVARHRARSIAELPHEKRLAHGVPIAEALQQAGILWYSGAAGHLDMVRGYTRPEIGLRRSWRNHDGAWSKAMNPRFESIGVASHRADDGWVVLVAVFIDEMPIPQDLRLVERTTVEAINRIRREEGLSALKTNERLARIAREHSADMARRDFVAHVNPDGLGAAERVDLAGVEFRRLGENIQMSRGAEDPVERAVSSWLSSPGHREQIYDPGFSQTGVGVALAEDGSIYFTQLFLQ